MTVEDDRSVWWSIRGVESEFHQNSITKLNVLGPNQGGGREWYGAYGLALLASQLALCDGANLKPV